MQEEANVTIAAADLAPLAHWVTPEIEIRRYDTRFFLARMPDGQQPRHDDGEMTAMAWMSPKAAIEKFERLADVRELTALTSSHQKSAARTALAASA